MHPDRSLRHAPLVLTLLLLSCAGPRVGSTGRPAEVRHLTVFSTGDTWGELEPCG